MNNEEFYRKKDAEICPICRGSGWRLSYDKEGRTYANNCPCGLREKSIMAARAKKEGGGK